MTATLKLVTLNGVGIGSDPTTHPDAKLLALLKNQRINNRLPVGLPAGPVIAHKTGDLDDALHDAGLVYGPKTTSVAVMMSPSWNSPCHAPPIFANLSRP